MEEHLSLFAAKFVDSFGTERVVVLHALDLEDALYCIGEGYGKVKEAEVMSLADLSVGVMRCIYERKHDEG